MGSILYIRTSRRRRRHPVRQHVCRLRRAVGPDEELSRGADRGARRRASIAATTRITASPTTGATRSPASGRAHPSGDRQEGALRQRASPPIVGMPRDESEGILRYLYEHWRTRYSSAASAGGRTRSPSGTTAASSTTRSGITGRTPAPATGSRSRATGRSERPGYSAINCCLACSVKWSSSKAKRAGVIVVILGGEVGERAWRPRACRRPVRTAAATTGLP